MSIAASLQAPQASNLHPTGRGDTAMHPLSWIPPEAASLLDVGCNDGALLADCRRYYPSMHLAGVDVNRTAVEKLARLLPGAEVHCIEGADLPFENSSFDCVTCIEVIEHVPANERKQLIGEIHRVLKPEGIFLLRCPYAGMFAWLDSNNLRFRLPSLYRLLVKQGLRDHGYARGAADVCWHHHFTLDELRELIGVGFATELLRHGGLLLFPIVDILRWPFYRLRKYESRLLKQLDRLAAWDLGKNYGTHSFDVLLVLRKTSPLVEASR